MNVVEMEYPEYRPAVKVKRGLAGLGLFADEPISAGDLIIEYLGDRISHEESDERGGRYLLTVNDETVIDGSNRSNIARYLNHSCDPNAEAEHEVTEDRIYIRAIKDIVPGEEITFHYGEDYFESDYMKERGCLCPACNS